MGLESTSKYSPVWSDKNEQERWVVTRHQSYLPRADDFAGTQGQSACGVPSSPAAGGSHAGQGSPGKGSTAERVVLEMVLKEAEGLSGQDKGRLVGG